MRRWASAWALLLAVATAVALLSPWPLRASAVLVALHLATAAGLYVLASRPGPDIRGTLSTWLINSAVARAAAIVCVARGLVEWRADEVAVLAQATSSTLAVASAVGFVLLAVLSLLVIGSGGVRVAEVAARFVLDALPGKQLGLDTGVQAGVVPGEAAGEELARLEREAHFFGAMDGAMRVLRAEAVGLVAASVLVAAAAVALHSGDYLSVVTVAGWLAAALLVACLVSSMVGVSAVSAVLGGEGHPQDALAAPARAAIAVSAVGVACGLVIAAVWPGAWSAALLAVCVAAAAGVAWAERRRAVSASPAGQADWGLIVSEALWSDWTAGGRDPVASILSHCRLRLGFEPGRPHVRLVAGTDDEQCVIQVIVRSLRVGEVTVRPAQLLSTASSSAQGTAASAPDGRPAVWVDSAVAPADALPWQDVAEWGVVRHLTISADLLITPAMAAEWTRKARAVFASGGSVPGVLSVAWVTLRLRELVQSGLPAPPPELLADAAVHTDIDQQRSTLRRLSLRYMAGEAGERMVARQLHPKLRRIFGGLVAGEPVGPDLQAARDQLIAESWRRPHWLWPMLLAEGQLAQPLADLLADRIAEIVVVRPDELPPSMPLPAAEVPEIDGQQQQRSSQTS